jgi:hypothetical protein
MCQVDFGDEQTVGWSETHRTARKDHRCGECARSISKGETYWYASGVHGRRGFSAKTCDHCHIASDWLTANCSGYMYGSQIEDIHEHAEANIPMLRIVVGARRQWKSFSDPSRLLPAPIYPEDMK